jgi:hypothetical protein
MSENKHNYGDEVLFNSFQRSFTCYVEMDGDPGKFFNGYSELVTAACRVLLFLRLAKPDPDGPFGYRPTPHLINCIMNVLSSHEFTFHLGVHSLVCSVTINAKRKKIESCCVSLSR